MSSEGTRKALLTLLSERERLRKELARVEKAIAALESPIERTLGLREALEKALKGKTDGLTQDEAVAACAALGAPTTKGSIRFLVSQHMETFRREKGRLFLR